MNNRTSKNFTITAIVLTVIILVLIYLFTDFSNWFFVWWLAWGITTFVFYGYDKMQAKRGGWRVPEIVLHLLGLVGGFIGGWLGMFLFRHKIRKPIFPIVLGISTLIQLGLYFWFTNAA